MSKMLWFIPIYQAESTINKPFTFLRSHLCIKHIYLDDSTLLSWPMMTDKLLTHTNIYLQTLDLLDAINQFVSTN